jgi:hypothetical protein
MRTRKDKAAKVQRSGAVRIALSLTPDQSAALDAVRGTIPASTWAREAVMRAVTSERDQ